MAATGVSLSAVVRSALAAWVAEPADLDAHTLFPYTTLFRDRKSVV